MVWYHLMRIIVLIYMSLYKVTTKRCDDIHSPKVNLEVAQRPFCCSSVMEFNSLPRHIKTKESFIKFS